MVLGEETTGKSEYIDNFFQMKFGKNFQVFQQGSSRIHLGQIKDKGVAMTIKFIDAQGYEEALDCKKWAKSIKKIISDGIDQYSQNKRKRSEFISKMKDFSHEIVPRTKDTRIHLALYFMNLNGPRIKFTDVYLMKKFSKYLSILPILTQKIQGTKASLEEIKSMKVSLAKEAKECGINWINCENVKRLFPFGLIIGEFDKE